MIKYLIPATVLLASVACQQKEASLHECLDHTDPTVQQADTIKKSIAREAIGSVATTEAKIKYHAPAVRGRTIWGGLVPYEDVWVTGAHSATQLSFSEDVQINGQVLSKGTYALFTIPDKEKWTIIINKNYNQHLTDQYDRREDIFRFTVTPDWEHEPVERLTYCIGSTSETTGYISMHWEKLNITFDFNRILN